MEKNAVFLATCHHLTKEAIRKSGFVSDVSNNRINNIIKNNLDKVIGTAQTLGTLAAGATGGTVGLIGGTIGGLAASILSGEYGTQNAANLVQQAAM
jgi:hypothetical protein